jgi:diphthamide biosynthesis protein 2
MDGNIVEEDNVGLIDRYNVRETAAFLHANGYKTIAAQFPDTDLSIAPRVSHILQDICRGEFEGYRVTVYVLADTTYNSLGVDEVASSHVEADCVVHYGRASLAPVTGKIPVYYVFPKEDRYRMDEDVWLSMELSGKCVVFVDQIYSHVMDEVTSYVRENVKLDEIEFPELAATRCDSGVGGYAISVREYSPADVTLVWFGSTESPAKEELMLTYNGYSWISVHPMDGKIEHGLPRIVEQTLRKRYYLVEKARDASIVGILVGTLGAAGYKDSINSLRIAAQEAGKKTYTLLMGKPNPAKLANFPEIDVFVLVADPQGHILDSKEYYKPIITPHEAMIAFSDDVTWEQHDYSLNLCAETKEEQADCCQGHECQALALQAQEALQITETYGSTKAITAGSSAQYLVHSRTWKGVEAPCAGSDAKPASRIQQGRHGRAATYENK